MLNRNVKCAISAMLLIAGCAKDKRIIFVTNTQVGARIGVDSRQVPEIVVGYNRQEAALVPIYLGASTEPTEAFNAENASLIEEARLLTINARNDANWTTGKSRLANGHTLLQRVVDSSPSPSLPLKEANRLAGRLKSGTNRPTDEDYALLLGYLNAELRRPVTAAAFDREAKAFGTYNSKTGDRLDALSVIGTFKGDGKGTSSTGSGVEARGSIAQYFATGMAAQILAEKAGAAAVSASAEPASSAETRMAALTEDLKTRQNHLDALRKKPLKGGSATFDGQTYTTTDSLADAVAAKRGATVGSIRRRGGDDLEFLIYELEKAVN